MKLQKILTALILLTSISASILPDFGIAAPKKGKATAPASGKKDDEQSRKFKLSKDKTNVDFDDANIDGMAKNPFGTYLNSRDQDFNRGFINIRKNWHDHMIMSVNGMTQ